MRQIQGNNETKEKRNVTIAIFLLATLMPVISLAATINTSSSSLILNEFLADGDVGGDPNNDGAFGATDDEFVEIVNITVNPIDISGYTVWESNFTTARHTFPAGTVLASYEPIVVFGGGAPADFSGIQVQVAMNTDPGINFGLGLGNSSGQIILRDLASVIVFDVSYDSIFDAIADQSLTLSPDLVGTFIGHNLAVGALGSYSPGTLVDGSSFAAPVPVPAAVWLFGSALGLLGWMRRKAA